MAVEKCGILLIWLSQCNVKNESLLFRQQDIAHTLKQHEVAWLGFFISTAIGPISFERHNPKGSLQIFLNLSHAFIGCMQGQQCHTFAHFIQMLLRLISMKVILWSFGYLS